MDFLFFYLFLATTGEMKMNENDKCWQTPDRSPVNKCRHKETIILKENVFILTVKHESTFFFVIVKTFISEKMMSGQKYE